jgi:hypothetical protein
MGARPRPDHLHAVPPAPGPDADVAVALDGEAPPLVAAGEYLGVFVAGRRCTVFATKRPALELLFELVSTAADASVPEGTRLSMWCRLGAGGRIPASSKWARTWKLVAGRRPSRGERRMTTSILRGKLLRLAVRTVATDTLQHELAPINCYSVVDRVIAVETGGGRPKP